MNVLITAPSLNVSDNVSGIASVVNTIIANNKSVNYIHLLAGKKDSEGKGINRFTKLFATYGELIRWIKEGKFDFLHLNLPLNGRSIYRDYITYKICKFYKKKVLVHLHGGRYLFESPSNLLTRNIIKGILSSADVLVTLSELEKTKIGELYGVKNVGVLPNTVDASYLAVNRQKENEGDINLLFLGRLHESKGLQHVIEAFELLDNKVGKFKLKICGKGPLDEYAKQKAEANPNIEFIGVVAGESKLQALSSSDIFLLPSLYGEGLPIALLEAMSAGLAPIVTDDGSMEYIINHKVNGLKVQKANTDDLKQKMEMLLSDSGFLKEISSNAKLYIQNNFSIKSYVDNLNKFYATLSLNNGEA